MATAISSSPTPPTPTSAPGSATNGNKTEGSSGFFGTLGTLGRKKKLKEAEEAQGMEEEGRAGIDGNSQHPVFDTSPEDYVLAENEERSMIEPGMINNHDYQELLKILINWINDELSDHRIIVKDLTEDLYDGQILGKLIEKLSGQALAVAEVIQKEDYQLSKLKVVLELCNRQLGYQGPAPNVRWTAAGIHGRNTVQIVHLLVALIRHFRAPIRLPPNVTISILVVTKRGGQLVKRVTTEALTESYDDLSKRASEPRDAFDVLFDHSAPERLATLRRSVGHFVHQQLARINIEVGGGTGSSGPMADIDPYQFSDGLNIIFLLGMLEGYFVPLGNIYTTASVDPVAEAVGAGKESAFRSDNYVESSPHHKLHNVNVALQLMEDAGFNQIRHKVRAEDVVNADLKAVLRVLYTIFAKYKNVKF